MGLAQAVTVILAVGSMAVGDSAMVASQYVIEVIEGYITSYKRASNQLRTSGSDAEA